MEIKTHYRKISKIKNEIKKNAEINVNDKNLKLFTQALLNDEKSIKIAFSFNGNDYEDEYDQYDMIDRCLISQYGLVSQFIKSPSQETYNQLLNAYFLKIIYFIAEKNYQKNTQNGFDTDRTLSLIFAMAYCDNSIQGEMMKVLEYYKDHQGDNYEEDEEDEDNDFYGTKTILPLAYHFYQQDPNNKPWSFDLTGITDNKGKSVKADIMANMTSLYQKAIEFLYTDNMELFKQIVDELCQYHLDNSKGDYLLEFNGNTAEYFPIEILFLLKKRVEKGLSIEGIHHILIDEFLPYFLDDFIMSDDNQIFLQRALNP
ncbi:hypothetical protein [Capnocytophaga sp.]|uniref:hypothetical protein n=1 Tax=Capnocytophaga sp. TaxID=44737 RepID=UPI0026DC7546|nr:hypothetical protein [Capnocytophaga sp.]MDO5106292.1 hypothetical protein [Capnocytophaga sp.]